MTVMSFLMPFFGPVPHLNTMALCLYIPSTARTMEPSGPRKAKPVPITVMHVVMATYQQICSFRLAIIEGSRLVIKKSHHVFFFKAFSVAVMIGSNVLMIPVQMCLVKLVRNAASKTCCWQQVWSVQSPAVNPIYWLIWISIMIVVLD